MSQGIEKQVDDVSVSGLATRLALGKVMGHLDYMVELMDAAVDDLPGWGFVVSDEVRTALEARASQFALEWASHMQEKHTPGLGDKARRAYTAADELPF